MQSTSLFILASLCERGAMHGHQLRLQAAEDRAEDWGQVSPGAIYGSLSRLAGQGLVRVTRTEQDGARPTRQVYEITDAGHAALATMIQDSLQKVVEPTDPFDLALAHSGEWTNEALSSMVVARIAVLEGRLAQLGAHRAAAAPWLSQRESFVVEHQRSRLAADLAWHRSVLDAMTSDRRTTARTVGDPR